MGNVVGIDLGTTNSVAAFKFAGTEIVTADSNTPPERKLTRSVVAFDQGKFLIGQEAYNQLKADPENVIVSIKRLMGRGFSNPVVQEQLSRFGYKVTQSIHGTENSLAVWLGDREYEPEDISAEILKKVVQNARTYQAQRGQRSKITHAVITVPAYFNDKQRHANRTAASRAGLTPLELLPEPTAAAISYGFSPDGSGDVKTILVYDFGGGTFDASVITASGNQFIELGKAGDLWLGGDDIDHLMLQFAKAKVADEEGLDNVDTLIAKMPHYQQVRFMADLRTAVERAKVDLSTATSVHIIPSTPLIDDLGMAVYIDVEVTREQFEAMLTPLVERTLQVCQDAIDFSEYTIDLVDVVLLVGGSSQMPLVQRKVQETFGADKVVIHPRPMYAVAEGAAIVAAGLTEKVGTVSRDYYIELFDDPEFELIRQGDILPVKTCHTFKTVADGQRLIHFKFFNRDRERDFDEPVGQMWLGLDKSYPHGTEVLVTLELDERIGDLYITAVLKNNPSVRVSSSFSRGKADEKIYEEVVQIIQDLNARQLSESGVEELNQRVVPIIQTGNQVIDQKTGRERHDLRQRAEKELQKLQTYVSEDRNQAEFLAKEFEFLLETCGFLIEKPQQERLRLLTQRLHDALDRNDLSAMQAYSEDAKYELANLPEMVRLVQACKLAIWRASTQAPSEANSMSNKFSRMLRAMERGDGHEADRYWREIQPNVSRWINQELPTSSIATGLTR